MHHQARPWGTIAVAFVLAGCGITGNFRLDPGFAPFDSPGLRDTDRELALSLGPLPLKLARRLTRDDPELSGMLGSLKAVRVYTYAVHGRGGRVRERIEETQGRLVERGWEPVVAVRDDGEWAAALVRMGEPDSISGFVVMTLDDEEVVLVNLIGDIQPHTFNLLMAELDFDLPSVEIEAL